MHGPSSLFLGVWVVSSVVSPVSHAWDFGLLRTKANKNTCEIQSNAEGAVASGKRVDTTISIGGTQIPFHVDVPQIAYTQVPRFRACRSVQSEEAAAYEALWQHALENLNTAGHRYERVTMARFPNGGSFRAVFAARDTKTGQLVAIKVYDPIRHLCPNPDGNSFTHIEDAVGYTAMAIQRDLTAQIVAERVLSAGKQLGLPSEYTVTPVLSERSIPDAGVLVYPLIDGVHPSLAKHVAKRERHDVLFAEGERILSALYPGQFGNPPKFFPNRLDTKLNNVLIPESGGPWTFVDP